MNLQTDLPKSQTEVWFVRLGLLSIAVFSTAIVVLLVGIYFDWARLLPASVSRW